MANLSKQQVVEILKNAPTGTTPEGIVAALREEGHQLEGYEETDALTPMTAKKGSLEKFADTFEKGLSWGAETFVSPAAREVVRLPVSAAAAISGETTPVQTPFGEVKPYSELTPTEAAKGAFEVATAALPVGKLLAPIKTVIKPITKLLPSIKLEKVAHFFTDVSKETFAFARDPRNIGKLKAAQKMIDEDIAVPELGEGIFDTAKNTIKSAGEVWKKQEAEILSKVSNLLPNAEIILKGRVSKILETEGMTLGKTGVETAGSKFSKNKTAEVVFNNIYDVLSEPVKTVESLLNKREAITALKQEIPKEAANVGRVVKKIVEDFDVYLDDITGGSARTLRDTYAKSIDPARKIVNAFTDDFGKLSLDKATSFIKQASSEIKFDKAEVLKKFDAVAGSQFAQETKALGVAKSLSRLDPPTAGRIKNVLFSLGLARVPVLSAVVSPKFWGEVMMSSAKKAAVKESHSIFKELVWRNLILRPIMSFFEEEKSASLPYDAQD